MTRTVPTANDEDGLRFVATVHRPNLPDVHLGYVFQHQAESACASLRSALVGTTHVAGTTITWSQRLPGMAVEPPVPTEPASIVSLIEHDLYNGEPDQFPDLFSRLAAQEGYDSAREMWRIACSSLDYDESTH